MRERAVQVKESERAEPVSLDGLFSVVFISIIICSLFLLLADSRLLFPLLTPFIIHSIHF